MYVVAIPTPTFNQADPWDCLQSFDSLVPQRICLFGYSLASRRVGLGDSGAGHCNFCGIIHCWRTWTSLSLFYYFHVCLSYPDPTDD
jgi:hypothetical protein